MARGLDLSSLEPHRRFHIEYGGFFGPRLGLPNPVLPVPAT
jgi:hypothetical protein